VFVLFKNRGWEWLTRLLRTRVRYNGLVHPEKLSLKCDWSKIFQFGWYRPHRESGVSGFRALWLVPRLKPMKIEKVLSICWKEGVRGFFVGNSTAYNILSPFDVIITFVLLQFREGVHVLEFYLWQNNIAFNKIFLRDFYCASQVRVFPCSLVWCTCGILFFN